MAVNTEYDNSSEQRFTISELANEFSVTLRSYARKLVTERSGGALGLFYPVLEQHSLDDLHELV